MARRATTFAPSSLPYLLPASIHPCSVCARVSVSLCLYLCRRDASPLPPPRWHARRGRRVKSTLENARSPTGCMCLTATRNGYHGSPSVSRWDTRAPSPNCITSRGSVAQTAFMPGLFGLLTAAGATFDRAPASPGEYPPPTPGVGVGVGRSSAQYLSGVTPSSIAVISIRRDWDRGTGQAKLPNFRHAYGSADLGDKETERGREGGLLHKEFRSIIQVLPCSSSDTRNGNFDKEFSERDGALVCARDPPRGNPRGILRRLTRP